MNKIKNKKIIPKKELEENTVASRRRFLKKSVYATPSIIVLGQLLYPKSVHAAPSGPPGGSSGLGTALAPGQIKKNNKTSL